MYSRPGIKSTRLDSRKQAVTFLPVFVLISVVTAFTDRIQNSDTESKRKRGIPETVLDAAQPVQNIFQRPKRSTVLNCGT